MAIVGVLLCLFIVINGERFRFGPLTVDPLRAVGVHHVYMSASEGLRTGNVTVKVYCEVRDKTPEVKDGSVQVILAQGKRSIITDSTCRQGELQLSGAVREFASVPLELDAGSLFTKFKTNFTGDYWLIFANCLVDTPVIFRGDSSWIEPWGHLSGDIYCLLSFYGYLSCFYLLVALLWFWAEVVHWKDAAQLQNCASLVLGAALLETTLWYLDFYSWNETGVRSTEITVFAILSSVFRRALSLVVVLAISLGYGICRPTLGSATKKVINLGVLYFLFESVMEFAMQYGQTHDHGLWWVAILLALPSALINGVFFWWIFSSLSQLIEQLAAKDQHIKLKFYIRFQYLLIFFLICALAFTGFQLYLNFRGADVMRSAPRIWQSLYAVTLVVMLILLNPNCSHGRNGYSALPRDEESPSALNLSNGDNRSEDHGQTNGVVPKPGSVHEGVRDREPTNRNKNWRFTVGDEENEGSEHEDLNEL